MKVVYLSYLELDFWDLEVTVVDQIEALPVFFEGSEVITNVNIFFSSGMPEIPNDSNSSFLALIFIDGLEIMPSCVR
jgi:hypothetical protein